ncbi:MAG: hypothetical protein FJZ43_03075 [Candidatus Staskawiczbacteria bacterium]|nr:hypothetical protein [Candidatus Staskawiczbacteria bacterium]
MKAEFKQELLKVIREWCEPVQRARTIIAENVHPNLSEDEAVVLLREAMIEATCQGFVQLKLAHVTAMD